MLIREAGPEDWPRIWPLWHRVVAAGDTYTWDPGTAAGAARALWMPPSARVFVVEEGDQVIATAYLKPNYGAGPAAHVANAGFMVDSTHAGRGIGRRLAEHVLDEARRGGFTAMVFNAVVETNPAVGLWRSLGFTILGTVPKAYDHPLHGLVGLHVMYREM